MIFKKEAANRGGLITPQPRGSDTVWFLFKLCRDARKRRIKLGAHAIDHGNDRDGNSSGDQSVFDGGSARVILQETQNKLAHETIPVLPSTPLFARNLYPVGRYTRPK